MDEWVRRFLCSIPYGQVGFNIIACSDGHGKHRLTPLSILLAPEFFKLYMVYTCYISVLELLLSCVQELFLMGKASVLERCPHFREC